MSCAIPPPRGPRSAARPRTNCGRALAGRRLAITTRLCRPVRIAGALRRREGRRRHQCPQQAERCACGDQAAKPANKVSAVLMAVAGEAEKLAKATSDAGEAETAMLFIEVRNMLQGMMMRAYSRCRGVLPGYPSYRKQGRHLPQPLVCRPCLSADVDPLPDAH